MLKITDSIPYDLICLLYMHKTVADPRFSMTRRFKGLCYNDTTVKPTGALYMQRVIDLTAVGLI